MVISLTTSSPPPHQREQVAAFLDEVLPRLEREPGVVAFYHFSDPETGESTTLVVWRDDASRGAQREGPPRPTRPPDARPSTTGGLAPAARLQPPPRRPARGSPRPAADTAWPWALP